MHHESRSRANLFDRATPHGCRDFTGNGIAKRPKKWTGRRNPMDILAMIAGLGRWT